VKELISDALTRLDFKTGCVDSTVPENLMMGEEVGNICVHRNVANLVVETDMNLLSALQYGVGECNVRDIIMCGHYECGGVRAALAAAGDQGAPLQVWLENIRKVYTRHEKELDAIADPNDRYRRFVELNVIEQCINVFKFTVVQNRRKETFLEGEMIPRVHAMIFDPKNGDLKRIPFDFSEYSDVKPAE
jgi:carbonic anhydrase